MFTLTDWGIVYLCLSLPIVIYFRRWLPALLIFSTSVQAASVVNISMSGGKHGITTYTLTALLAGIFWLRNISRPAPTIGPELKAPLNLLLIYALIAIMGSVLLPNLFAGTLATNNTSASGFAYYTPPLAVHWGLANLVQAINLLVHMAMLLYLLQRTALHPSTKYHALLGFVAAVVFVISVGFYERGAWLFGWKSLVELWSSNPTYAQFPISPGGWGKRIGVPFSEASFASAFLAAATASFFALTLWGRRALTGLCSFLLCIAASFNAFGTTGLITLTIILPTMLTLYSYQAWKSRDSRPELLQRLITIMVVIVLTVFLVSILTNESSQSHFELLRQSVTQQINKIETEVIGPLSRLINNDKSLVYARILVDIRGIEILLETSGLGIGMGSARMSSFLISMLALNGILGTLLWFGSLGVLTWRYMNTSRLSDGQLVAIFGLLGCTLAMMIAIPDLNMPMYWAFIFLAFVFCPEKQPVEKSGNLIKA